MLKILKGPIGDGKKNPKPKSVQDKKQEKLSREDYRA